MPVKHQMQSYRNINGVKLMNYADLIMGEVENNKVIAEAKANYSIVRKIKCGDFYRLFVNMPINSIPNITSLAIQLR